MAEISAFSESAAPRISSMEVATSMRRRRSPVSATSAAAFAVARSGAETLRAKTSAAMTAMTRMIPEAIRIMVLRESTGAVISFRLTAMSVMNPFFMCAEWRVLCSPFRT